MNVQSNVSTDRAAPLLTKTDSTSPALIVTGPTSIAIRAATIYRDIAFADQIEVMLPVGGLIAGTDYVVRVVDGVPVAHASMAGPIDFQTDFAGFHFAPGANATARKGGDETPAINPRSLWDLNFRPACNDPRGMTLVDKPGGQFWCDIYLLGVDHVANGTSRFGVTIADGNDPPKNPARKTAFKNLDYNTAIAVRRHHGKQLPSLEEFFAAAFGVSERSSHDGDPKVTKLDAPRTSKWGVMQATGNLWVWGHDGDPDEPRASIFGGSWWHSGVAGSRYALVGHWSVHSSGRLGARGRSDHLQLA